MVGRLRAGSGTRQSLAVRPPSGDSFRKRPQADPLGGFGEVPGFQHSTQSRGTRRHIPCLFPQGRSTHTVQCPCLSEIRSRCPLCANGRVSVLPPPRSCSSVSCPLQAAHAHTRLNSPEERTVSPPKHYTWWSSRDTAGTGPSLTTYLPGHPHIESVKPSNPTWPGCGLTTSQASRGLERQSNAQPVPQ